MASNEAGIKNEYVVGKLKLPQIRETFTRYMTKDFPPNEIRPLNMIERALELGKYVCYGYFSDEMMSAYAFLAITEGSVLVDYFAVERSLRSQGLGSRFLQDLIHGPLGGFDCALLEVDDPDYVSDPRAQETCMHRIGFYMRNGLIDTGVRASVNNVKFRVLALPVGHEHSGEDTLSIYLSIYRDMPLDIKWRKKLHIEGSVVNASP